MVAMVGGAMPHFQTAEENCEWPGRQILFENDKVDKSLKRKTQQQQKQHNLP